MIPGQALEAATDPREEVGAKATRKLKARRNATHGVWYGLGMMGLIGWSVATPTVLGAALGLWLDKRYPGPHSWTLTLLIIGLIIGCLTAWRWWPTRTGKCATNGRMAMRELLLLAAASAAGLLLGAIFFGGLWFTVRKGVSSQRPALGFFSACCCG